MLAASGSPDAVDVLFDGGGEVEVEDVVDVVEVDSSGYGIFFELFVVLFGVFLRRF